MRLNATGRESGRRNPRIEGGANVTVAFNNTVISGPVTVSSMSHGTKWEGGWVNFILPTFKLTLTPGEVEEEEEAFGVKLPTVGASDVGTYRFQLTRPREHTY